jgi:hypothetical protein
MNQDHVLYNGDVLLRFDVGEHKYFDDEGLPDGVTSVVKIIDKSGPLTGWAAKVTVEKLLRTVPVDRGTNQIRMSLKIFEELAIAAKSAHKEHLTDAGNVGHQAHACIEATIRHAIENTGGRITSTFYGKPPDPRAVSCVRACHRWIKAHDVRFLSTERVVYSKLLRVAGTLDGLAIVDGKLSLIDWKSSNGLYPEYCYQTAAYEQAYEEETGQEIMDRWIIRLGKSDGAFETWHMTPDDFEDDIRAFVACLKLLRAHAKVEARVKGNHDSACAAA